ncbi:MAG: DUF2809 domain-containing protein [Verrucomicrobiaceae bacterium]|nr:MAG: DUF2809 domain-containing protein [Verrucomicrobiaceae bacterium]
MRRNRLLYAVWIAMVIVIGLATRSRRTSFLPDFIRDYAGDTLWALMVFLLLGFIFPRTRTVTLTIAALAISFSVEFSQIYQADWINEIRATRIGALVLGRGWVPVDLLCYTVGVIIGLIGEILANRFTGKHRPTCPGDSPC